MKTSLRNLSLVLASSAPAFAQAINVDIGIQPTFSPLPASTFGAAAGQAGVWNGVNGNTAGPFALVDLAGAPTSVTVSRTGPASTFASDNLSTSGDDAALMDDGYDPGTISPWSTWTFSGLTAGDYRVYTYAWAPDSTAFLSRVTVAGSVDGPVAVGGWPNPFVFVQGTADYPPVPPPCTHSVHHAHVTAGGTIAITVSNALTFGTLDGFQIVPDSFGTPFCIPSSAGVTACVCGNANGAGAGCANTGSTGGKLVASGNPSLALDATDPGSVTLAGTNMLSGSTCIFLQGPSSLAAGVTFGGGIRCVAGQLMRLYVKQGIVAGAKTVPEAADRSISNRTSDLFPGLPITGGSTWYYQAYYRDPGLANPGGSCPANATFNITGGQIITWTP